MTREINEIQPYLFRRAYYLTKDHVDAQDLLQDTLLKAITKIHLFTPGTNFKNWTSTIMRNIFINNIRKRRNMNVVDFDDYHMDDKESADNSGEYEILREDVEQIVASLNPNLQQAIELRRSGHNYKEIADVQGVPLGTVKNRIHQARKEIRYKYNILMNEN